MKNKYLDFLALFGVGGAHPGGLPLTEELLQKEQIHPDTRILDIGCGTGQTAFFLVQTFGCKVTAVDKHPLMIEKTKNRFQQDLSCVTIVQGDAENLEFEDESFDIVISESVVSFTTISQTLPELFRVLKPGGRLIMIEMTAAQPLSKEEQKDVFDLYGVQKVLCEDEWKEYVTKAGFQLTEVNQTPFEPGANEVPEFSPSDHIDKEYYDIWLQHTAYSIHSNNPLVCRIYRCTK
ncbi:methyltransferase domain-containing protein [Halobacillus rhizosphaerae]|uniref:class I SAM-dependent methyltransferase n=1 Tax=Halobacillus rhizosphaerae TaxID=3064889 RepID=UPI00398B133D